MGRDLSETHDSENSATDSLKTEQPPIRPYEIALAMLFGLVFFALLLEAAVRIGDHDLFSTESLFVKQLASNPHEFEFDPKLAWVPISNGDYVSPPYASGVPFGISTDEYGFRKNKNSWQTPIAHDLKIMTVGDSFTFSNEVSDEETWPNHLQEILKTEVVNGGVPMYGLDQVVLRLEGSVDRVKPSIVAVSITQQDIERTAYSKQIRSVTHLAVDKPYFAITDSGLVLKNDPVVKPNEKMQIGWMRATLGRSHLADRFFRRFAVNWWLSSGPFNSAPAEYATGFSAIDVSCRLLERVKELGKQKHFVPVIVAQSYWQDGTETYESDPMLHEVTVCSQKLGLETVDIEPVLREIYERRRLEFESLFLPWAHMLNRGNLLVAQKVAGEISGFLGDSRCESLSAKYSVSLPCSSRKMKLGSRE